MKQRLTAVLAITTVVAATAACSDASDDTAEAQDSTSVASDVSAEQGTDWEGGDMLQLRAPGYEDVHVDLAAAPETLAVDTFSAQALWPYGIRPEGIWGFGMQSPAMKDIDAAEMTVLGENGEFSLEKMAELNPDLMIGFGNSDGTGWTFWDEATTEQVTAFCPFLPIGFWSGSSDQTVETVIEGYRGVAEALGADVDSPEIQAAQQDFDTALTHVSEAAAERDDITVAMIATGDDKLYFANDSLVQVPALKKAGVNVVAPEAKPGPWTEVSWEELPAVKADVILVNANGMEAHQDQPLFQQTAAAQAGQVYSWDDKRPFTYANYAEWFEGFAKQLEGAKDVVS